MRGKLTEMARISRRWKTMIVALRAEHELRWRGRFLVRGFFDGEHYFLLERIDERRTRLIHGEIFSGLLVPILGRMLMATKKGFEAMNAALKEQAECAPRSSQSDPI